MNTERGDIGGWIIVIVTILIMLLLVGYFNSTGLFFGKFNAKSLLHLPCGITIKTPEKNARILFPIQVKGYANECGWIVQYGAAGTAQVLDAGGVPVTRPTPLTVPANSTTAPYYFETVLIVYQAPHTDTGHLVLTSTTGLVEIIPVRF